VSTSKRFYLNDTLSLVSTVLEDCVNRTMVGEAFGVDSGDTWELQCRTSHEAEEYSNPRRWMLDVQGRVTHVLKSDEGELAGRPSVHVLGIEANKINDERTVADVDFNVDDLREYFNRLLAEMERFWPQIRSVGTARPPRPGGRPVLERKEVVNRVARAQDAEEMRKADPIATWKEIARAIGWGFGSDESALALLRDARHRLHVLEEKDPDGLLDEVAQLRANSGANQTKNT